MKRTPDDDHCSARGAHRLAARIVSYWKTRGFDGIRVDVLPVQSKKAANRGDDPYYGIVSNIGPNGYPPRLAT